MVTAVVMRFGRSRPALLCVTGHAWAAARTIAPTGYAELRRRLVHTLHERLKIEASFLRRFRTARTFDIAIAVRILACAGNAIGVRGQQGR